MEGKNRFNCDLIERWRNDDRMAVIGISIYNLVVCSFLCVVFVVFERDMAIFIGDNLQIRMDITDENVYALGICLAIQSLASTILILAALRRGHLLPILWLSIDGTLMIYYIVVTMSVTFRMLVVGPQVLPTILSIIALVELGIEFWFMDVVNSRCRYWEKRFLDKKRRSRDEKLMPRFIEITCNP